MRQPRISEFLRILVAALCVVSLAFGDSLVWAQDASSSGNQSSTIPPDQLDSLVAPVALYPDPLLAQVLAASTYPLEIVQLQQWLDRNTNLTGQALADAVAKEPWDPSVQSLAAVRDVVKRLSNDIQWTTDLGNAFLAQEGDVMAAVQRMRKKAQESGHLKSTEQLKVETQTTDNKTVIVIQPPSQEIVYVPSYDPMVVWGAPVYPYPTGYYAAGMALSFGAGVAMGAFWGGGWGWNTGWGSNNIYVNRNNNFYRNTSIRGGNRVSNLPANGRWQHNPQHRGGAPYRDRGTANRFGGTTRGDSLANRQSNARQQLRQQGGNVGNNRPGGGLNNRPGGGNLGDRGGVGNAGNRPGGGNPGSRPGGGNAANRPGGGNLGNRPGGGNAANRPNGGNVGNRPAAGGGDRIGSRNLSGGANQGRNAFGSGTGFNGARTRTDASRGASSMGSRGGFGGGGSRGGGGGGRRGGGGGGGRRR